MNIFKNRLFWAGAAMIIAPALAETLGIIDIDINIGAAVTLIGGLVTTLGVIRMMVTD